MPMLSWLIDIGADTEETNDFGHTALRTAVERGNDTGVAILLQAGAQVDHKTLHYAQTRSIALQLLDAGADPHQLSDEGRRAILGIDWCPLEASAGEFERYRSVRFGTHNPEIMNNPFWEGMIRSGLHAYGAGKLFGDKTRCGNGYTPIWCAERFGQTLTLLPDGRIVQVAGEHEDYYMPDFCIYNDVFVHAPDGRITIYGYPEEIFPPTDFHSATLIGHHIYLIGSLGYQGTRLYGETPVYRLDTTSFQIDRVATGGMKPGWISSHRAMVSPPHEIRISGGQIFSLVDGQEQYSDNANTFILDVERRTWRIG
jgi:hypothetical protein